VFIFALLAPFYLDVLSFLEPEENGQRNDWLRTEQLELLSGSEVVERETRPLHFVLTLWMC
jgi:hypothetical protein